jgi:hypothetical protein
MPFTVSFSEVRAPPPKFLIKIFRALNSPKIIDFRLTNLIILAKYAAHCFPFVVISADVKSARYLVDGWPMARPGQAAHVRRTYVFRCRASKADFQFLPSNVRSS